MPRLSATDVSILAAHRRGSLEVERSEGRYGAYWTICDEFGVLEVALTQEQADRRIEQVTGDRPKR
jgi:hypothetical protein